METQISEREYTKQNPGCYHDSLRFLSKLTGIAIRKEIEIDSFDNLYEQRGSKRKLKYKSYDIVCVSESGEKFPFFEKTVRFDQRGLKAVKFIITLNRSHIEFGIPIKNEGTYSDSLGGGWSQNVALYSINGNYFADMDCACR